MTEKGGRAKKAKGKAQNEEAAVFWGLFEGALVVLAALVTLVILVALQAKDLDFLPLVSIL